MNDLNVEVTLSDMLDAREKRVAVQREIIERYKVTLISFTLNIPGNIKVFPLSLKAHDEAVKLITKALNRQGISIIYQTSNSAKTGCESYFVVKEQPITVKRLMMDIENSCALGRIFDIDVIDGEGNKISRSDLNITERSCLLCDDIGHVCSRSRKHSLEELQKKVIEIMENYFEKQFADNCAACAGRALLYEVCITPKPGLVDRNNNGSHKDMDIYTFIDSATALIPYFRDIVLSGIKFHSEKPKAVFERIRYLGILAEDRMFTATNNINTHKGLIFSLGIICASAGYLYKNEEAVNTDNILKTSREMTLEINNDFNGKTKESARTFGEKLYATYGITGIRGEAASGFASVKNYGLPILKELIEKGYSLNHACSLTLLNLIANVKDTNIIARSSIEILREVQLQTNNLINERGIENISIGEIMDLDNQFIGKNLSPGGCADLLAITLMLYFLEN
ncbi:triphosphoribosyl-dephospho-CoA synthase CitG [Sedimentibacter hydroxybenzoicus DSM 7310]|uniref:Probable 2-(5''-triphosphoribosyl)-3'-dephosphocoenzyme-A synthase n=1 Tax=Sedimentibacter hydroxybenzoicus DSM 7310 TaxID=1123245 RepID=A0A974BJA0_SEDHY|nr:triphosphoribosyl-dephospho-CoA synthase CitG [Sedimentibacter hydroxybenzoicus]NYB73670.1 triphosphoribosyl-dephospho-CoA synthase CitG [Sedimentibacter hydroxybenzoicus DSM 7310]